MHHPAVTQSDSSKPLHGTVGKCIVVCVAAWFRTDKWSLSSDQQEAIADGDELHGLAPSSTERTRSRHLGVQRLVLSPILNPVAGDASLDNVCRLRSHS